MKKQITTLLLSGAAFVMSAQTPQNIKTNGNTLSSAEYIGTNNNEDLTVKTNGANNTIFKKNGDVKMTSLQGTGNRLLYATDNGLLRAYPIGQAGQVLSTDGIWIDPPQNYWQISNNGNRIWTNKNKVGINMNSQPLFTLDVNGDGHFTGNLVLNGELIINEKITSPKQLFAKSMEVDSIKMDSNKAIYGETTIKGDVKAKYKLSVDGDATFNGNSTIGGNQFISGNQDVYGNQNVAGSILARQGLKFTSGKGISETTTAQGQVYAYGKGGSGGTGPFDPGLPACFNPTVYPNAVTTHQFGNLVQIFSTDNTGSYVGGGSVLNMQSWETLSSIDAAGGNPNGGLLLNYFCGKDVAICTGAQGGTVFTGVKTSMAKNVGIGNAYPLTTNMDDAVALNIYTNDNVTTALKLNVWDAAAKAIDLVNPSDNNNSYFSVLQNGTITSKNLEGTGVRSVLVDGNGMLITGAASSTTAGSWDLGGNVVSVPTNTATEYFGTSSNSDLIFATNATPRMVIKDNGNIGFGNALVPTADFEFAKTNADCQVKISTNDGTKLPKLSFGNGTYSADIYLGSNATSPSPFVMDWGGKHFLSFNNGNMLIGDPDNLPGEAASGGDIYTKLTISAKTSPNANFWNAIPLNIVNPDLAASNKSIFKVDGVGYTTIAIGSSSQDNAFDIIDRTGTTDVVNFRVKRNGEIYGRKIKITIGTFADYVFEKNYTKPTLEEVEKYINTEKHLPNVPSAKEIAANGADVGELVTKNFEKTEELFLYLIEMNKRLNKLEEDNKELRKQNEILLKSK